MSKKQSVTPPVTLEEFQAFVKTWKKLKPVLKLLAPAISGSFDPFNGVYIYHHADGFHDIGDDGVEFYCLDQVQYEDYYANYTANIPITAILNPEPVLQRHQDILVQEATKQAEKTKTWERNTHERLRKLYESE